jgi:hypothetical protein
MKTGCSENFALHIPHEEQAEVAFFPDIVALLVNIMIYDNNKGRNCTCNITFYALSYTRISSWYSVHLDFTVLIEFLYLIHTKCIILFIFSFNEWAGARGSVVGWGTMLQSGRSPVQVPDKVDFFNTSNRTMALGSTQPLTEMSTRPGG